MVIEDWSPRKRPDIAAIEGRFVRLDKLSSKKHAKGLFETLATLDERERAHFLKVEGGETFDGFQKWIDRCEHNSVDEFYAVIDPATGKAIGKQAFLRIDTANGSVEMGYVHWSPLMARSPKSTEAFYLMAKYVFEDLGYRRFEWKCDSLNAPSWAAAERFGMKFEGIFRNHMVRFGKNRDTAWFSLIDTEWPATKKGFEVWFSPDNFDQNGQQKSKLYDCIIQERDKS